MPWPDPVIGITSKFSYRGGRGPNQPYISECFIHKHIIFPSKIEGFNFCLITGISDCHGCYLLNIIFYGFFFFGPARSRINIVKHIFRNIFNTY